MAKKQNLVLVTVDCLRADHVGFHGYDVATTPFLDSLAGESVVFERAIVAGLPTYYSFPAILAARSPFRYGRDVLGLVSGEETLATTLRSAGWRTAALTAGNPYLTERFGYDRGFDRFETYLCSDKSMVEEVASRGSPLRLGIEGKAERWGWTRRLFREVYFRYGMWRASSGTLGEKRRYPSARTVVDDAVDWLRENPDGKPFFIWLHVMDPHHPYFPAAEALEAIGRGDLAPTAKAVRLNAWWNRSDMPDRARRRLLSDVMALYDAGIRWVDMQLQRLVETLSSMSKWEQTLFAITSDHGEEFLEQGSWYHHPVNLGEHLIHVPLLMHGRSLETGRRPALFSLRKLPSLLLQELGVTLPSAWSSTSSAEALSPYVLTECVGGCRNPLPIENRLGPRMIALEDGTYKLVVDFRTDRDVYFRVQDGRDIPIAGAEISKKKRAEMYASVLEHIRGHRGVRDRAVHLDEHISRIRRRMSA